MKFTKMHGCGNDYVYVNCFEERADDPAGLARALSDRHFGVGADGLILILPSQQADVRMRMFNADGSEAEMCGNGIRCVAKYALERGLTGQKNDLAIETGAGIKKVQLDVRGGRVQSVRVDMGAPRLERAEIPMLGPAGKVVAEEIEVMGRRLEITCVSMGNPHCVVFVEDVAAFPVDAIGPALERHPSFPSRTNVEFVQILGRREVKQRTWERGAGETLACGTGACAAVVAASLNGRTANEAACHLLGGDLEIEWRGHVFMTGPATEVFTGEWPE